MNMVFVDYTDRIRAPKFNSGSSFDSGLSIKYINHRISQRV